MEQDFEITLLILDIESEFKEISMRSEYSPQAACNKKWTAIIFTGRDKSSEPPSAVQTRCGIYLSEDAAIKAADRYCHEWGGHGFRIDSATKAQRPFNPLPRSAVPDFYLAIDGGKELVSGPYPSQEAAYADADRLPSSDNELVCVAWTSRGRQ